MSFWRLSLVAVFVSLIAATDTRAAVYEKLLDDIFPTSLSGTEFTPANFVLRGTEELPAGARLRLDFGSLQWGRVDERLVLPRIQVRIDFPEGEGVQATVLGRTTPLCRAARGRWVGEVLLPLASGRASEFTLAWKKGEVETTKTLWIEKVAEEGDRVAIDTSCSSSQLEVRRRSAVQKSGAWISLNCRWVMESSDRKKVPGLDLWMYWDGQPEALRVNGVTMKASEPNLYHFRLHPGDQPLSIETKEGQIYDLSYRLPPEMNLGFVGVGMGPYHYRLSGGGANISAPAPVLTVYGSYQLAETVRLTAFNATTIHKNFFTDTGLYVKTDSFRFFDQRISVYLMFGANFFGFKLPEGSKFKFGAPQGFEAVIRDFLKVNRAATLGAFIYPPIEGKSYYNVWLRYGSPKFFGEVNYIEIRDRLDTTSIYTRSAGVSIGFPLARLF